MKPQFYSKPLFWIFMIISAIAILIVSLYCYAFLMLSGLAGPSGDSSIEGKLLIFAGIIPIFYIISSMIIITRQQRGETKWDYFLAPLLVIPCSYIIYFLFNNLLLSIYYGLFYMPLDNIYLLAWRIVLLATLIPFYAFGKVLIRDLFKKR